ncbi:FAD-dependent oxidoreductase [bacterium]|nr:FAD-dependent oxidoreductase [bacterium]
MTRADLTVRGGGIFGLSVAWEAVQRGARVRLIESERIGAGASGGLVGALAPHTPEGWNPVKAFQLASLLAAEDWWRAVEAASGLSAGYARAGRLQGLADAAAVALARARGLAAETLWQGRAHWRVVPATGADWEPPAASGFLIHDTLSARVHPQQALAALTAALSAKAAEIVLGEAEEQGAVIWAIGAAGLEALSRDLGRKAGQGVKGQAVAVHLPGHAARPQLFIDGLHIVPHADGSVAIGSTTENQWTAARTTDAQADALLARARDLVPLLRDAPEVARWAGLRPRAASRGPLLGAWPGRPGHFIANGGFKIGFGIAPEAARLICDLVLDGRDGIPAEFAP